MAYNLLSEPWLPVTRLRSGLAHIAPHQLTENLDGDPVVSLAFPRPDLNAAVLEWLIGLVQTVYWDELKNNTAWVTLWESPPPPEDLHRRMEPFSYAFELLAEGDPAFMQDRNPEQLDKSYDVDMLFFEVAGQKAAWFVKPNESPVLCPACAAAALHMLQAYAYSGGAGVRTGLRGGGPLSTIIMRDNLWETTWANVLPAGKFGKACDPNAPEAFGVFPWLAPTRVSSEGTKPVTTDEVHPLHLYWAMPRRMRLRYEEGDQPCAMCASTQGPRITGYAYRHHGNNYEGEWDHPLTPLRHEPKDGTRITIKGKSFSGYRDWLGLVFTERVKIKPKKKGGEPVKVTVRTPAPVVEQALHSQRRGDMLGTELRLRASGFSMDQMKPLAFTDEVMPVVLPKDADLLEEQHVLATRLINAAEFTRQALYSAARTALLDERKDAKGTNSMLTEVDALFWSKTQPVFDDAMRHGLDALEQGYDTEKARRVYLRRLQAVTEALFRDMVQSAALDDTQMERHARAWRDLQARIRWPKAQVWNKLDIDPKAQEEEAQPATGEA
ncbi:type I-E CRISPR-associated protein Cse1/CasA [Desulfohalovibrio reitneri]|uniref:type I-E CRISPR-associated protein Cse1/CasA n=1 Tax=Desulfohalovibrio reitneri TaxID=1307759 RepID=UPI0004A76637|nr:type I-E CRISPR-associated protein Cse1/CasA [Desulfohalovibrio reitneri]